MSNDLLELIQKALDDLKGQDISHLNVKNVTDITDDMVFCTGTSNRHVKSLANNLVTECKQHDVHIIGVEGDDEGEWVLVDLGDAIVHIMLPKVREFYAIEKLWSLDPKRKTADEN